MTIKVVPRATRDEIVGMMDDGTLKVRVTAAPVDQAANIAVRRVLAKALALKPRNVEILHGNTSRRKILRVSGMNATELHARLALTV